MIDFNRPDRVIAYIGGAAGRLLVHLVMLSDEVFTWNPDMERHLVGVPSREHVAVKLEYIKNSVFPNSLKNNHSLWKNFEPAPWHATFEPTAGKLFVRHAWMRESLDTIRAFGAEKIAFVNCGNILHWVLTAAIEKNAECLVYHTEANGIGPGHWYRSSSAEKTKTIIKDQLHAYLRELERWEMYQENFGWHEIILSNILFSDQESFRSEYLKLCDFFTITPEMSAAFDLRNHWLALHDYQLDRSPPTFYDIAFYEFRSELQDQKIASLI